MISLAIFLSFLAGISILFSRIINGNLAERIGFMPGVFINNFVGIIVGIIFLVISKETFSMYPNTFVGVPLWIYMGGVLGVAVVVLSSYLNPKVSSFYLTLFIFLGQLFTSLLIDFYLTGEFSGGKTVGGILVLSGLTYNLIVDKKVSSSK